MFRTFLLIALAAGFMVLTTELPGQPQLLGNNEAECINCDHGRSQPVAEVPATPAAPVAPTAPARPAASNNPIDPPVPFVRIRVRVAAQNPAGQDIEYHILVENISQADAHMVVVKNPVPAQAQYVYAKPEPKVTEPELQWHLGSLAPGECKEIVLYLRPTGTEDIQNCARVQFEYGQCVTTHLVGAGPVQPPPTPLPKGGEKLPPPKIEVNPPETKQPPIMSAEELGKLVVAVSGPDKQYVNIPARYFVTVRNIGKGTANNVLVDATLADRAVFLSASEDGKAHGGVVAWLLGNLPAGESRTVSFTIKSQGADKLCHTVRTLADRGITDSTSICTLFTGVSALMLETNQADGPIEVGGETSYPIQLINQGTLPLTNLRVTAHIGDGLTLTRAKGPADHKVGAQGKNGQELFFDPLPSLAPGQTASYEVFVKGRNAGDQRFRVEVHTTELEQGGPVIQEESTHVFSDKLAQ